MRWITWASASQHGFEPDDHRCADSTRNWRQLAEILETIAAVIRERLRIKAKSVR
jgi:hypothetical protein